MSTENIGKTVTWGPSPKTGVIVNFVPAGSRLSEAKREAEGFSSKRGEDDVSGNDRYLVRVSAVGAVASGVAYKWYAPRAKSIDVTLAQKVGG